MRRRPGESTLESVCTDTRLQVAAELVVRALDDGEFWRVLDEGRSFSAYGVDIQLAPTAPLDDDLRAVFLDLYDTDAEPVLDLVNQATQARSTLPRYALIMWAGDIRYFIAEHAQAEARNERTKAREAKLEQLLPATSLAEREPDEAVLEGFEERAVRLESLPQHVADVTRPFLLEDLHAAGFLSDHRTSSGVIAEWLRSYPALLSYFNAAQSLHQYLHSPERARVFGQLRPRFALTSAISVDWFRLGPYAHPEHSPASWLALNEQWWARAIEREDKSGERYTSSGHISFTALLRRDNGLTLAIVRAGDKARRDGTPDPDPNVAHFNHPYVVLEHAVSRLQAAGYGALALKLLERLVLRVPDRRSSQTLLATFQSERPWFASIQKVFAPRSVQPVTYNEIDGIEPEGLRREVWCALSVQGDPVYADSLCALVRDSDAPQFTRTFALKRLPLIRESPVVRNTLESLTSDEVALFGPYLPYVHKAVFDTPSAQID